jgi:hypothetical protein
VVPGLERNTRVVTPSWDLRVLPGVTPLRLMSEHEITLSNPRPRYRFRYIKSMAICASGVDMSRPEPTILEGLQAAGLRAELVAEFKDIHRRRRPCECRLCEARRHEKQREAA